MLCFGRPNSNPYMLSPRACGSTSAHHLTQGAAVMLWRPQQQPCQMNILPRRGEVPSTQFRRLCWSGMHFAVWRLCRIAR